MEPPIQRRRKPVPVQLALKGQTADDYILLGEQDKFAPNVKYRVKSADVVGRSVSDCVTPKLIIKYLVFFKLNCFLVFNLMI